MRKPDSLRQHLLTNVAALAHDPDRLLVFIDDGKVRCTAASGLSFEYEYTLNLIFTEYAGHPNEIVAPLLDWLRIHQPEALLNLDRSRDGIRFEADILDESKVDLSLTLALSERVIVRQGAEGLTFEHAAEPALS